MESGGTDKADVNVALGEKGAIKVDNVRGLGVVKGLELQENPLPHFAVHIQLNNFQGHELPREGVPDLLHNPTAPSANILQYLQVLQLNLILRLTRTHAEINSV